MERISYKTKADVLLKCSWQSLIGQHEEIYFCKINVWRDIDLFPAKIKQLLLDRQQGDSFTVRFKKGELFGYSEASIISLNLSQFQPPSPYRKKIKPLIGRFYPLGFFVGLEGVFPENSKPVRVIGIEGDKIWIDTNIPISKYEIELEFHILQVVSKSGDIGGECKDWCAISLENGPGMQIRFNDIPTDFELDNPDSFKRQDESEDIIFYKEPRITTHIDSKCHENLLEIYRRLLPKNGNILDLMSSYQSHVPESENIRLIGLGLNEEEMKQNRSLSKYIIHDINKNPKLPFVDEEFDAVVCDLSIEYVTKPFELIKEVRRILKKDGIFTVSFSNRYFPTKVVKIWIDLHEFERMGYVLELLLREGGFKNFKTFSVKGFRRPYDDKYFGCTLFSDPLYLVYAEKNIRRSLN